MSAISRPLVFPKFFLTQHFFLPKWFLKINFFHLKIFLSQFYFCLNFILDLNFFLKNLFGQKYFGARIFLAQMFFFWTKSYFLNQKTFLTNNFLWTQIFWTLNFEPYIICFKYFICFNRNDDNKIQRGFYLTQLKLH